ncbi:Trp biosynthesis-associated membrane protein [Streptomyces iconiensis]|uniref:Trp biosynthesis-associated membrane protein n=1 Tax=Streptomyces iconiensis TaxID=1384038 RepID=A0ABT6ZZQ7_9ACTN|nr:Trp biosynthesis-associated membrane protein [Streptomyces iconiensis]MDJ1134096.1 Trp biosynthesis-associated membrane protein [Streptomyces iconiensis]
MIRNSLGSLLALIGAAVAVWSPFRPWYDGRHGRDFRLTQLFEGGGITGAGASLFTGLFLVMLVVAVLTVLGIVLRSRLTVTVAAVLALGFTILWMVRQGQAAGSLTAADNGLNSGAGMALGGGVLLLAAAVVMRGRAGSGRHRKDNRLDEAHADTARPDNTRQFPAPPPPQNQPSSWRPQEDGEEDQGDHRHAA